MPHCTSSVSCASGALQIILRSCRFDVTHPVVNDQGMTLWRALGISSWPTLAVVSPQGKLLTVLAGEGHQQDVDDFVAAALQYYGERDLLRNGPLPQVWRILTCRAPTEASCTLVRRLHARV